ncbi:metal ABC transporter solute-binding protein, Zn/Mn family [Brumimicrobium mesophilum]|uniref:metal ABC transporter solute-binding protein, Zn/Mn family n=1 Tax=Brumimicrobium mesophilum TaxID=392717 RepID=UPI000D144E25|nr:zinc ABC transporter substrate-binding protein [Brumimicrobium mesophilum]
MKILLFILLIGVLLIGCSDTESKKDDNTFNIVTTTSMITDLVKNIGGDSVVVQGLMGAGVDPHLYKASEGDVNKLSSANMILYNGLHLEGKLVDVFERMKKQNINAIAVTDILKKENLIGSTYFASNYDPHIWFDIGYWEQITLFVADKLSEALPESKAYFQNNAQNYLQQLKELSQEIEAEIATLSKDQRRLVTAHDAFNYFGMAFDFDVVGLQGLSTATEAGVQDVQETAKYILEHKVKAVFIESSVPRRTVEALQASVNSNDHAVAIGGTLYSDALGDPNTEEGTYIGMFRYNVKTIVNALK